MSYASAYVVLGPALGTASGNMQLGESQLRWEQKNQKELMREEVAAHSGQREQNVKGLKKEEASQV